MGLNKRAQVLMSEEEYAALERLARQRGTSVGALIREAVRSRYLGRSRPRTEVVEELLALEVELPTAWSEIEGWIEERLDGPS